MSPRGIHVLGIESSCDDTGVAIIRGDGKILSNSIHSQLRHHINHGGIIPMVAKEYHMENIDGVARQAFKESGLRSVAQDIDAIAVTNRPGMEYNLRVGLNYARTLAKKYCKPLIPIHHMQAHALMPLLHNKTIKFPFLVLLISGGHCLLSICERYNKFHYLGGTVDGSPGDLLDKVARRMRLKTLGEPYDRISGGAAIEKLSQRAGVDRFKYFNNEDTIVMNKYKNCDFSFSGYRGKFDVVAPYIDELWQSGDRERLLDELGHVCGSLQRIILLQLIKKLQRAIYFYRTNWRYKYTDAFNSGGKISHHLGYGIREREGEHQEDWPDVVVSGGVAANRYLIENIESAMKTEIDANIRVFSPAKSLCSDNGLMIAWNGLLTYMDYLDRGSGTTTKEPGISNDLDYSVILDGNKMDLVMPQAECKIGEDISYDVKSANFSLSRFKSAELKLKNQPRSSE